MSRDCEVIFNSNNDRDEAYKILRSIREENSKVKIFNEIEIREKSLFIILTYPFEINKNSFINVNNKKIELEKHVVFIAIKNGKHQSKGYAFFSNHFNDILPEDNIHVKKLSNLVYKFFDISSSEN